MASTWRFQQENSTRLARLGLTDPSSGIQSRQMPFVEGAGPDDKQGSVLADALNVHEATGLTPSQLQARVAELEAALREALPIIVPDDIHNRCAALLALYHKVRQSV